MVWEREEKKARATSTKAGASTKVPAVAARRKALEEQEEKSVPLEEDANEEVRVFAHGPKPASRPRKKAKTKKIEWLI